MGPESGVSWSAYALTQTVVVARYLGLAVWPHKLVFDYGFELVNNPWSLAWGAAFVLCLATGTLIALVKRPALGLLGFCFFAVLAPTSLIQGSSQTMAEHRMYLGLAPLAVIFTVGLWNICRKIGPRLFLVVVAGCAGMLGCRTYSRNADYGSRLALWSDTVQKAPGNPWALEGLAVELAATGRDREAIQFHRRALGERPDYPEAHYNLGTEYAKMGDRDSAIAEFGRALELSPGMAEAAYNEGLALAEQGRFSEAEGRFRRALGLCPELSGAHLGLGAVELQLGRPLDAARDLRLAANEDPSSAQVQTELAMSLAAAGRREEAENHFRAAATLRPDLAETHENLGLALRANGRASEAESEFAAAERIKSAGRSSAERQGQPKQAQ